MTTLLTILLALLLVAYLIVCGHRWGVPEMVSDTYYQGAGRWFTALMGVEAAGFAIEILKYENIETLWTALGIIGCIGLLIVGLVPMYHHCGKCHWAHKVGAWLAAIGCIGWCIAVNPLPTMYITILYASHMIATGKKKSWYVAEVSAFLSVYATLIFS